ncbi:hypothetical protein E2R51_14165 [Jeotgalibacillus sp. S-D1]|uniref:hypothetical protein n=1 Tax=Jeotgalibacillus sp. S-D1 TaxID=2552189 RepID=UPI00105A7F43|nr:hypothetical protein [Jeotgalibacillus sp. S-D1]TDL31502.1 hypothetical protein E2R51_14165 [Jeotgalibacillus sp. S-D1]
MKKMLFLFIVIFLTACNQANTSGSYAMIVVVNDNEYNGTEKDINDYELKDEIGKVTKKVSADVFPNNYQSNFFEKGSIIYSVKSDMKFIVVEDTKGERHLLQEAPGDN